MSAQNLTSALQKQATDRTYSAYLAVANQLDRAPPDEKNKRVLRIAILRNYTIEPLLPVIKGEIAAAGLHPTLYIGDFDAIARDVFDPQSDLFGFEPDFIIITLWLESLAPTVSSRLITLTSEQVNAEVDRVLVTINEIVTAVRLRSDAAILINNFPLPIYSTLGILDAQSELYLSQTTIRLNLELLRLIHRSRDVYLVDYMSLMARLGSDRGIDERYWHIGRAPISRHALVPLGREYGKFFRALSGKTRKCLVLDCDNTLWGGILGEDGPTGIQVGTSYPGSCYHAFQQEVLNLHDRGVLLALCSKNNENDVHDILHNHPDMLLRREHFATQQINWDDKVTNLLRISEDLNIGLDSIVFVDDSRFECDMVKERLPQVAVLQLSADPSSYKHQLSAEGYFDLLTYSDEDQTRTRMYRQDTERKRLHRVSKSLEEYLEGLEMVAVIGRANELTIPRLSQLSQKTNQFNLTTRRYSEGDITSFAADRDVDVIYLRLRDRISEMGIIGLTIVKFSGEQADIDTFLLSCRAIGRGIEDALLFEVLRSAQRRGCTRVRGKYHVTPKNGQVADFYKRHHFRLVSRDEYDSDWVLTLSERKTMSPSWVKIELIH